MAHVDYPRVVRDTVNRIGYDRESFGFDGHTCAVITSIDEQSPDIAMGVDKAKEIRDGAADLYDEIGAGDQGMMFGYACDETDDLMPMPIWFAHRLAQRLAEVRQAPATSTTSGPTARPRSRSSTRTASRSGSRRCSSRRRPARASTSHGQLTPDLRKHVIEPLVPAQFADDDYEVLCNPTGNFELGGPHADCGLTGRKIIVDTYGGMARHGGGAFSGKDPTKVDRSAAYAVRHAAKNVVAAGHRQAVRGAGRVRDRRRAPGVRDGRHVRHVRTSTRRSCPSWCMEHFDLRPAAIIDRLQLRRPIFQRTAAYGHFGRPEPTFTWESTDQAAALKKAAEALA